MYFLLLLFGCLSLRSYQTSETELVKSLLSNTTKFARPVINSSKPVSVTFGFELVHLVSIIESEQTLKAKMWLRMYWKNEHLKWDPNKWGGVKNTRLDYENVWTPDIFLTQDVGDELSSGPDKYKTLILCSFDGSQQWFIPVLIESSCIFDVMNFPYDRQRCSFTFLSWSHDQGEIDIVADVRPIVTNNYIESAEWSMVNVTYTRNVKKYNCCPNPYVDLNYTVTIDRRAMYYIFNAIIPCVIQMIIILFTFFLPPDSGERIGVVITVLLVFAVYLEVISGNLPKTSNSVPALSLFYIAAMAASSCSLIATCFVLIVHFKGAEKGVQPMPKWVSKHFIDNIGYYIGIRKNLREHDNEELLALENDKTRGEKGYDLKKAFNNKNEMYTIVEEVRVITQLIDDQNLQDEVEEEWQTLGKVLDRIFFFVFMLTFIIISVSVLLPVYIHYKTHNI